MDINSNAGDVKPQRRLSNFQIKEVSLVDEAANNHKFIIAKSKHATTKDATIFNDDQSGKNKPTAEPTSTEKNVNPLTFAQLVLLANDLDSDMRNFFGLVKDLSVEENGNFSMGPELTGRAVSMLEKLSDVLFIFGSESTLGFDSPAMMAKALLSKDKDNKEGVEKVGKPMNGKRLQKFEDSVKALQDGLTGLQGMLEEIKQSKEVSQMTEEQKKAKEAELQKRLKASQETEEAKIRKELGLDASDASADAGNGAGKDDAGKGAGSEGAAASADETDEVAKLKATVEKLEKAEEERVAKAKENEGKAEIAKLQKRIADLEGAGGSNAGATEETDVNKGKGSDGAGDDKTTYVEKNGRKVRKGLFKGIMGAPLKDVIANQDKSY